MKSPAGSVENKHTTQQYVTIIPQVLLFTLNRI